MVDSKYSFSYSKYKKQERATNSEEPDDDEALLRQPISKQFGGFREVKKAYENGTEEVRRLIMKECSLIYECIVCRNMFRSLKNFICHKRNYCSSFAEEDFHSFEDRIPSMFIQTVDRSAAFPVKSRSTDSSPIPNSKSSNRDLCKVIERLKRVEVSKDCTNYKTFVADHKKDFPSSELENVQTSKNSLYQTFKSKNDIGGIKTELEEAHDLLENQNILNFPNGKEIDPVFMSLPSFDVCGDKKFEKNVSNASHLLPEFYCEICNMQFQSETNLKTHVDKNHTSTTYVFQCPTCSMTFSQPAAVIRHLASEHKKPLRRIRKLRDTIFKKRIQIGDEDIKGMDRVVKRRQITNTKEKNNSNTVDQQNGIANSSCSYCLTNFERKAALAMHLTKCFTRIASMDNTELLKNEIFPNKESNEVKIQDQNFSQELEHNNQNYSFISDESNVNIKQEPQDDLNTTTNNNSNTINKMFENLENQTFGNGLHTVCLENIEITDSKNNNLCEDPCEKKIISKNCIVNREKSMENVKAKRFRVVSNSKLLTCRCKICNKQFNALSNLRRHISMFHYRSKRFGCNLCDYRAFRRYDIVNHLTFVHKMTGERESMAVEYVTVHEVKYSKNDVEGDIVLVNEEAIVTEHNKKHQQMKDESRTFATEIVLKTYEKDKSKKEILRANKGCTQSYKKDSAVQKNKSQLKVVRRKLKKPLETQDEDKKRPIRNRIKAVNKDFVYDLLTSKEEQRSNAFKRSNAVLSDQNNFIDDELTPPPVKIIPYRLRAEPLIPVNKYSVKSVATNVYRNVIHEGLASPSTLPELPTERPQMRSRLISSSRNDLSTITVIESSELEAAGLKSTFFDDSFLEKFAKKSNPSFKMKPLLAMQHSPLNSILQKFDASQRTMKPPEESNISLPNYNICVLKSLTLSSLKEKDATPNGKQILKSSSLPAAPKKRITLMERLAENRAKRRDTLIRTTLEN